MKKTGPPLDCCLYQCKAYKLFDELQCMVRFCSSWMVRDWGLCCSSWLLTSVQKDNAERTKEMSWDLHGLSGDGYSPPSPSPDSSIIITSTLSIVCFLTGISLSKGLLRTEYACLRKLWTHTHWLPAIPLSRESPSFGSSVNLAESDFAEMLPQQRWF
jgi:hypothetical protein